MENFGNWSILTTNFLVVLYLALAGVTFASILHMANGQWRFVVRFFAVSTAALFPLALVLLIIILIFGDNTFQWLPGAHDGEHHLNGWHNFAFLATREVLGLIIVMLFFGWFIRLQRETAQTDAYAVHRRFRNVALLVPFFYVLYGTMVAWDFEMTMVPGWHSASYGAYQFVSMFHFFLAFFAVMLFVLNRSGKLVEAIPRPIFNYLAQMMLGFTILWTYFYFTQYLIMWYGRLPEEMFRFDNMMQNDLSPLWWIFLACKFVIPFVAFATWTPNRHNPNVIVVIAGFIMIGTWIERYTWLSGSVEPEFYHLPMSSIIDIIVTIVILGIGGWLIKRRLSRDGLIRS